MKNGRKRLLVIFVKLIIKKTSDKKKSLDNGSYLISLQNLKNVFLQDFHILNWN